MQMTPPQKRNRQRTGDLSPESHPRAPPAKRAKTRSELEFDAWASWEYPPRFWDTLSKIHITSRALGELDRRISARSSLASPPQAASDGLAPQPASTPTPPGLARFARHGGPDLRDLRGYSELKTNRPDPAIMSSRISSRTSRTSRTRSTNPASTPPTSVTNRSKKSTPYDRNFDLHLTDHCVHPVYSSKEPELTEIMSTLAKPRPSLSPSQFSDGVFKTFRQCNARAKDEDDVLANVIPTILGSSQMTEPSARNTTFGNLEPLTDGTIAPPKPDIYYGAHPEVLFRSVRNELGHHIVPSSMQDKPMAPNFFVEVKGPDGSVAVATRQARYDGAVGSRAMDSLQNYGRAETQYDGQVYTFSSTYHDGMLKIYAHHSTEPTTSGGPPEYHMTQVDAFAMSGNREGFVRGATAFRNARDLAKRHRDTFIQAANTRASRGIDPAPLDDPTAATQLDLDPEEESSDDFVDCTDYPLPGSPDQPAPVFTDIDDCSQASVLPELETASSFTSSSVSGFTTESIKRLRQPLSPDSKFATRSPPSKSRQCPGTARRARKPHILGLTPTDEAEHLWVKTYWHKGQVCFLEEEDEIKTDQKDWILQTREDGSYCFRWQGSTKPSICTSTLAAASSVDDSIGS
ncbi:glyoxylate reductase [Colletotrichum incanum]|uniref:Glyoxylate reductase n=1 Tax=Colletotrichum incanum TaxID=1573173 RepID=A0A161VEQ1_COLIC|nr:glyoxylate reductase [Colletotrichum incanum]